MRSLVHAELLKLRTTRMLYGNALLALVGVPLAVALAIQTAGHLGSTAQPSTPEGVRNVLSSASSGTLLLLVIGILLMTNEARHNTATATFLITPDRTKIVAAKLAAVTIVGLALAAAASALTLVIALPWLAAKNVDVHLFSREVGLSLLGSVGANTLYAVIGVGVGCLVRNQTAAITASFVWMMVVEGVLTGLRPGVGRWLPGGAANALTSTPTIHGGMLPMWAGALLLAAYGLVLAAAGTRFTLHKDIT